MSLKTAIFGTFLLIFLTVVLFAIQSSETQAAHRDTCEGGGPDGGWSACEVGRGRHCGTGYKTCLDSHSSRYNDREQCILACPNNQRCNYNRVCGTLYSCTGDTSCRYGTCEDSKCIEECTVDSNCYPIPEGYTEANRASCYRAKCSYTHSDDDDGDGGSGGGGGNGGGGGGRPDCGEGRRSYYQGRGCGYECLSRNQQPSCDECPSCSGPLINSSDSNCGATRTTRCEGGCTAWASGVDCNELGFNHSINLSCDYSRCACSDRTTCLDSRYTPSHWKQVCGLGNFTCLPYRHRNGSWGSGCLLSNTCFSTWIGYRYEDVCLLRGCARYWAPPPGWEYVCRSGVGNASSLSFNKRRVCFDGTWRDIHTNGSACDVALRAAGANPDWHIAKSGMVRVGWYWNSQGYARRYPLGSWVCPVPPLAIRNRSCWPGIDCGLNSSGDIAVCYNQSGGGSDCVFEGRCYPSADRLLDGARDLRNTWRAHGVTVVADVDNGSEGWEYCDRGSWRGLSGGLRGQVTNMSWHPVQGARVTVLGAGLTAITDAGGYYHFSGIPVRTLGRPGYGSTSYGDVIAEDLSGTYDPAVSKNLQVRAFENTTRNFVLKRPLGRDCNDDCTDHRGVCSPRCHGTGSCLFSSRESMEICDGYFEGGYGDRVNGSQKRRVLCCKGEAFEPEKVVVELCEGLEDVARVQKSVLFRGRFVTMNVLLFDGKQCKSKPIPHALR